MFRSPLYSLHYPRFPPANHRVRSNMTRPITRPGASVAPLGSSTLSSRDFPSVSRRFHVCVLRIKCREQRQRLLASIILGFPVHILRVTRRHHPQDISADCPQ